jgi:hypothetical protein
MAQKIAIGKVDSALVDENGFYIECESTKREIVRRFNTFPNLLDAAEDVLLHAIREPMRDYSVSFRSLEALRSAVEEAKRKQK